MYSYKKIKKRTKGTFYKNSVKFCRMLSREHDIMKENGNIRILHEIYNRELHNRSSIIGHYWEDIFVRENYDTRRTDSDISGCGDIF